MGSNHTLTFIIITVAIPFVKQTVKYEILSLIQHNELHVEEVPIAATCIRAITIMFIESD